MDSNEENRRFSDNFTADSAHNSNSQKKKGAPEGLKAIVDKHKEPQGNNNINQSDSESYPPDVPEQVITRNTDFRRTYELDSNRPNLNYHTFDDDVTASTPLIPPNRLQENNEFCSTKMIIIFVIISFILCLLIVISVIYYQYRNRITIK